SGFLVKDIYLSESIIDKLLPDISLEERSRLVLPDIKALSFSFNNKEQIINKDTENFDFELSGSILINWKPNTELLKELIAGKNKSEVTSILRGDPSISKAFINIIPFWSKYLPNDKKKIDIILE
ncbi:MAG: hypothetical protein WCW65_02965, partial [Candidatus Paceibacterota bacterium]